MIGVGTVAVCGLLTASAARHVAEANATPLPIDDVVRSKAAAAPVKTTPPSSKQGEPLAARNMFCSSCVRLPPAGLTPPGAPEPDGIPRTSLPIELLVTNVAQHSDRSFATIRNPQSGHQGAFWVGDSLPVRHGGSIRTIAASSVIFRNTQTKRLERVSLVAPNESVKKGDKKSSDPKARLANRGIRKLNATTYELDRDLVKRTIANFRSVRGARFRPYVRKGKLVGFRAYGVRRNSIPASMGLRNGDVITGANGEALDSMDAMLGFYRKLGELSRVTVSIDRRRKPMTFTYVLK